MRNIVATHDVIGIITVLHGSIVKQTLRTRHTPADSSLKAHHKTQGRASQRVIGIEGRVTGMPRTPKAGNSADKGRWRRTCVGTFVKDLPLLAGLTGKDTISADEVARTRTTLGIVRVVGDSCLPWARKLGLNLVLTFPD